ncbi:hypothetical protein N0V88_008165 [Collariella sp. IMI 366227]|nr:hypothetical protein N0V88_008165 [Collariella sp. IMI 366227]
MGLNIIDRIQAKIELFRLEQRYTRHRNRRSTFVSNAVYVDGEYIQQTPNTTGSSSSTSRSASIRKVTPAQPTLDRGGEQVPRKKLNRWSSMPGFGSSAKQDMGGMPTVRERSSFQNERY